MLKTIKMKNIIFYLAIVAATLSACNSNNNKSIESEKAKAQNNNTALTATSVVDTKNTVSVKEIVNAYIQMKNAFAEDNSTDAAGSGEKLETVFKNFDISALTPAQKKTYEDIEEDAREHAEHIGKNGGNIAHQREHFEMLSKDIYDLVKTFGGGQVLYKDFDPMYNNGKGAFWLSETKEIKNPYMGKAMLTSGSIKEEIK
jgi:hypothetical protein